MLGRSGNRPTSPRRSLDYAVIFGLMSTVYMPSSAVVTSKNGKSGYAQPTARNNIFETSTEEDEFDPPELE
jgi:hypothetical protein